jgi:integration host factor subunit alpha
VSWSANWDLGPSILSFGERPEREQDMTVAKTDLVESLIRNVRLRKERKRPEQVLFPEMDCEILSREKATRILNTLFEIIKEHLARGEDVRIRGFGQFQVKFRWARKGRNPQTGEAIILRSRRVVTFRPSKRLREGMNTTSP